MIKLVALTKIIILIMIKRQISRNPKTNIQPVVVAETLFSFGVDNNGLTFVSILGAVNYICLGFVFRFLAYRVSMFDLGFVFSLLVLRLAIMDCFFGSSNYILGLCLPLLNCSSSILQLYNNTV